MRPCATMTYYHKQQIIREGRPDHRWAGPPLEPIVPN